MSDFPSLHFCGAWRFVLDAPLVFLVSSPRPRALVGFFGSRSARESFLLIRFLFQPASMRFVTLILLTISNLFMTFAWYGHLKFKTTALGAAIVVSWLIAFAEYCFQVPANRIGSNAGMPTAQLKTFQEVITLAVFCVFSVLYLKEPLKWNYLVGFALIAVGALFVFAPWQRTLP